MSRRKIADRNVRKIARIGPRSLGITLPVEFLADLGWREKQKVKVLKQGRSLLIRDWRPKTKV